ncbi:MAG: ABC transporter permease [Propionibacteriaceae bacterium]|jgi:ABC-2 type transport system permease protein|nr:ABC transporter permease [Propionibacteriaceae bacterium]
MPVFRTALRVIFRHPVQLLVYIGLISLFGLVIIQSSFDTATPSFSMSTVPVAVIDRDHSPVSESLTDFLGDKGTLVEVDDSSQSIQDAVAQGQVALIVIVPHGYGSAFIAAARDGATAPEVETITSFAVAYATLAQSQVDNYLNGLRLAAVAEPVWDDGDLVAQARAIASVSATFEVPHDSAAVSSTTTFDFFFVWSSYPMTLGITALVAMAFTAFNLGETRRRQLASPMPSTRLNLQIMAASLVTAGLTWVYLCLLALLPIVGGAPLWVADPSHAALVSVAALVFTSVPLSLGFLLAQFQASSMVINAVSNVVGLAMMFLSGLILGSGSSVSLGGPLDTIKLFLPSHWYAQAIAAAGGVGGAGGVTWGTYLASLGIVVLFAVALLCVALAIGRFRVQSSDGNVVIE